MFGAWLVYRAPKATGNWLINFSLAIFAMAAVAVLFTLWLLFEFTLWAWGAGHHKVYHATIRTGDKITWRCQHTHRSHYRSRNCSNKELKRRQKAEAAARTAPLIAG